MKFVINMARAFFNCSYISKKNTGIGETALQLMKNINSSEIIFLSPIEVKEKNIIKIPGNLSPNNTIYNHIRRLFWVQFQVPKLMRKYKVNTFISPLPETPLFINSRNIVLVHDLIPLKFPKFSFLFLYHLFYVPLVLHQAKMILCNSVSTARDVKKIYRIPSKKVKVIKLGFDKNLYYPKNLIRENFFLVIGRHNPYKNLTRLLKAFKLFNNKNYKIIFVGPFDKRFTPKLKKLAKKLCIDSQCEWRGWVSSEEKLNLLNTCKALYIISLWEGFGLPALEALACGTEVVCSNRGGLPEIVLGVGNVFDPKDINQISYSMKEISLGNKLSNEFEKKRILRSKEYSWELAAEEICNLIS